MLRSVLIVLAVLIVLWLAWLTSSMRQTARKSTGDRDRDRDRGRDRDRDRGRDREVVSSFGEILNPVSSQSDFPFRFDHYANSL